MENKRRKLKIKETINMDEKNYRNDEKPKNTSKIAIKSISIIVIVVMLALTVGTVILSTNATKETEEAGMQAMEQKGDYIKDIKEVTESNEYMDIYTDENGEKVPVPKGYVGSSVDGENTVKEGYVIYEKTQEEINSNTDVKITDDNKWNEMKTRNQYVWVPVGYVGNLYKVENGKYYGKPQNFYIKYNTYGNQYAIAYKEPIIVEDYDTPSYFKQYGLNVESTGEFLMNLEMEFETSLESIAKYGGFYIGRYETGVRDNEKKVTIRRMNDATTSNWYKAYEDSKKIKGTNQNIVTSLIYGCQFDYTLQWLINRGVITRAEVAENSDTWGNYYALGIPYDRDGDGEADWQTYVDGYKEIPTGSSEYTKRNNIYDLAGNVTEWTMGASSKGRSEVGIEYIHPATYKRPAGYHDQSNPNYSNGYRVALYVK